MAPKLAKSRPPRDGADLDETINMVFEVEQQTQAAWNAPMIWIKPFYFFFSDRGRGKMTGPGVPAKR